MPALGVLRRRPVELLIGLLGAVEAIRLVVDPRLLDIPVLALFALLAVAAFLRRRNAVAGGPGRASEAESFARILHGLARSGSPEAIVSAIIDELGIGTGATHVAVVRRRPEAGCLEAVLSATRPGTPQSRTTFPLSELELPTAGRRARAVQIQPDPLGDPTLVSLGLAPGRAATPAGLGSLPHVPRPTGPADAFRGGPDPRPSQASPSGERYGKRVADHLADRLRDAYGLRNLIAAPLRVDGRIEGAIVLARRVEEPWPESARRILEAAAIETSAALGRLNTLRDAEARATIDALTGLPNRRYFDEYVALLAKRRRAEDRIGVLMIDLDHFKVLNDTYGHAVGDKVLQAVARSIAATVRDQDVPARFGGEEFVVLLKNPGPEVALEVGERVRRAIGALDLSDAGVPGVSVSVGVAVADTPDRPLVEVILEADQALYRAKRSGRDRVVAG
jgi:diguanylate cyclase (GGDEF)-like protein